MAYTTRYSSLWDRWRGDESGLSQAAWDGWLAVNAPEAVARNEYGGYVADNGNPRSWQITPATLAQTVWSYLRGSIPGATVAERNAEVQRRFSLSGHELLQLADVRDHITATGNTLAQLARWQDFACLMDEVEQRVRQDKTAIYALFGIRADSANG